MTRDDDRARAEFTGEAEEILDTLSRDLVDFEAQGQDVRPELVNKIFRDVHTLKPNIQVIPTSCKTGAGLDAIAALLAPQPAAVHA